MRHRLRLGVVAFICTAAVVFLQASFLHAEDPPPILFSDQTLAAGIDHVQTIGDDEMTNIVESAGVGCAFLDFDGDGWMDIYLVNGHWKEGLSDEDFYEEDRRPDATDKLYRNLGDGSFEDVTEAAGVAQVGFGMGVVAADYDADGDLDIYVTNYGPNYLYRNEGDGTFIDVAVELGVDCPVWTGGSSFADFDRDGVLDLYVGNYLVYDPEYNYYYAPDGFTGPLAYSGEQDLLFRGDGSGGFVDATAASGLIIQPIGRAMGVSSFDYDNDGFMDVFVSNDAMENYLLHNQGDGSFENRALRIGVAFGEAGEATAAMAVEVSDFDQDGYMDIFVPDIEYSCLYRNNGGRTFEDRSAVAGIAAACGQYTSWGSVFADFDLDGVIDLYIANGDAQHLEADDDLLFRGDGKGGFVDVSEHSGEWSKVRFVSRGVARADYDNDGDLDLLVASLDDRPVLLRNDTERGNRHWVTLDLVGSGSNRDAIGAVVRLRVGENEYVRQRLNGGSYLSQHDHRIHFGLGESERIDSIQITWPDNSVQILEDQPADQHLRIEQLQGAP